jgi:hypothetical protein
MQEYNLEPISDYIYKLMLVTQVGEDLWGLREMALWAREMPDGRGRTIYGETFEALFHVWITRGGSFRCRRGEEKGGEDVIISFEEMSSHFFRGNAELAQIEWTVANCYYRPRSRQFGGVGSYAHATIKNGGELGGSRLITFQATIAESHNPIGEGRRRELVAIGSELHPGKKPFVVFAVPQLAYVNFGRQQENGLEVYVMSVPISRREEETEIRLGAVFPH